MRKMQITNYAKTAPHKVRPATLCGASIKEHETLLVIYYTNNYTLRSEYDNDKNVSVYGVISYPVIGNFK